MKTESVKEIIVSYGGFFGGAEKRTLLSEDDNGE